MGGAEKFLITIANFFNKNGIPNDILILSNNSELSSEVSKEINIFKLVRKSRYDVTIFKKIKNHIKEQKYSKVFCINTYAFFFVRMALFSDKITPIILSPHTTKPFSVYKFFQNWIYYRFIRKRDKIIYLCKNQQQYLKKLYQYASINDDIIYNGINTKYFNPDLYTQQDCIRIRRKLGILNKEKIIVQIARISPEKKHINSLKALSVLHNQYNIKAHLIFVGGGDEDLIKYLKREIVKLDIKKYVHLVGNQSDVRPYYYISNMFTLSSESETFPISALEAMSFGLPCVLTNVGGVKEIIVDKEIGRIADAGNHKSIAKEWNQVLSASFDPKIIRKYLIDNFNDEIMLKKYERIIYENMVA
jgi:glycosyltransferase involved in cell wall biosynthesis